MRKQIVTIDKFSENHMHANRRRFLTSTSSGLGLAALASLLRADGLLANEGGTTKSATNPLAVRAPHFTPRAKRCIFIFLAGAGQSHLNSSCPDASFTILVLASFFPLAENGATAKMVALSNGATRMRKDILPFLGGHFCNRLMHGNYQYCQFVIHTGNSVCIMRVLMRLP